MVQRQGGRFTKTSLDAGNGVTCTSLFERRQLTGPEVSCALLFSFHAVRGSCACLGRRLLSSAAINQQQQMLYAGAADVVPWSSTMIKLPYIHPPTMNFKETLVKQQLRCCKHSSAAQSRVAHHIAGAKPSTGKPMYSETFLARQNATHPEAAICVQERSSGPGFCAATHGNMPAVRAQVRLLILFADFVVSDCMSAC